VLKAYYAAGGASSRTGPVASILADRALGLFSLILVAVAGAAWNFAYLSRYAELRAFWWMLTAVLLASAAAGMAAIAASERVAPIVARLRMHSALRALVLKILSVLSTYNRSRGALFRALALSVPCHLLACAIFYICFGAVSGLPLNPGLLLLLVPLGLMTTALPLAPGGIGVGQAAFYTLFQLVFGGQGSLGASAFTVYQMVLLLVSLSGVVFYLRYKTVGPPPPAPRNPELARGGHANTCARPFSTISNLDAPPPSAPKFTRYPGIANP
jgi:hypothetical protein